MAESPGKPATVIGIFALVFFAFAVIFLAFHFDDTEVHWSRITYVYGGVEAIAFAAAGWFFGKEVNRQRADKAEERADRAQEEASTTQGKLSALLTYVDTQAPSDASANAAVVAALKELAELPSIKDNPHAIRAIDARRGATRTATDPQWDKLVRFARGL